MQKQDKINVNEIDRTLEGNIAGADQLRAEALSRFSGIRRTKEKMLVREQARLSLKLGPGHPRVTALTERIALNCGLQAEVAVETQRAKTETPAAGPGTWVLHGYVRDMEGRPLGGLTLALYDRQGIRFGNLGYGCTDARGYFKLEAANPTGKVPVFLHVLDSQGRHLHIDRSSLTPTAGRVDYREITLTGTTPVCSPPDTQGPGEGNPPCEGPPEHSGWIVRGKVSDSNGRGLPGLIVSVYDKDLLFDDRLGTTETNQDGDYHLVYRTSDFRDLIERRPDLYLKITDRSGNLCYTTEHAIQWNAGRTETINVVLPIGGGKSV